MLTDEEEIVAVPGARAFTGGPIERTIRLSGRQREARRTKGDIRNMQ